MNQIKFKIKNKKEFLKYLKIMEIKNNKAIKIEILKHLEAQMVHQMRLILQADCQFHLLLKKKKHFLLLLRKRKKELKK